MPDVTVYAKPLVAVQLVLRSREFSGVVAKHVYVPLDRPLGHVKTRIVVVFAGRDVSDIHFTVEASSAIPLDDQDVMQRLTNNAIGDALREFTLRRRLLGAKKADVVTTIGTGTWKLLF